MAAKGTGDEGAELGARSCDDIATDGTRERMGAYFLVVKPPKLPEAS